MNLPWISHLVVGKDALSFLQGQLTLDLRRLQEGEASLTAYCSAKGKVQLTAWVALCEGGVRLWVRSEASERLGELIRRYGRFSQCQHSVDTSPWSVSAAPHQGGIHLKGTQRCLLAAQDPHHPTLSWDEVLAADLQDAVVLLPDVLADQFFPAYLGLIEHGAVGFDKGCYLGQEVIARMHHRTISKQHLYHATLAQPQSTSFPPGTSLCDESGGALGTWLLGTTQQGLCVLRSSEAEVIGRGPENEPFQGRLALPKATP